MTHEDIMATASHYSEVDHQGYVKFAEDDLINFANAILSRSDRFPEISEGERLREAWNEARATTPHPVAVAGSAGQAASMLNDDGTIPGADLLEEKAIMACPYCGSYETFTQSALGQRTVVCDQCDASGPCEEEDVAAIEAWNRIVKEVNLTRCAAPIAASNEGSAAQAPKLLGDGANTPWRVVNHPQAGGGLAFHRPFVLQRKETGCTVCYAPDGRLKRWKSETEAQRVCNRLNLAYAAPVAGQAPEGWKLVRVNEHFDALIEALERAESKGYLPDALAERWANFACDENVATPIAALTTDAGATKERDE